MPRMPAATLVLFAALGTPLGITALASADAGGSSTAAARGDWLTSRGLSASELAHLADNLRSEDPRARETTVNAVLGLHEESLPGMLARLAVLKSERPTPERARELMTALRHAAGSRRADDRVDRAAGVLAVLARTHDASAQSVIEPLLYLRAFERMGSQAALVHVAAVLSLDPGDIWDHEARLLRERHGLALLPALIALRSHGESRIRNWAQQGVNALGTADPAIATTLEDSHLVAQIVRAYSEPLDFQAMPTLVRLTTSEKLEVRDAARSAVARFGRNAIWQLRLLYEEVAGQRASTDWDAERTAKELYAVLDRSASEEADTLLAQGMEHLVGGRLAAMAQLYDRLLALFPFYAERNKLAPGYAALGEQHLEQDKLVLARNAYQRALRLDPTAADAKHWRAQLAYTDAELALSKGVVDLEQYADALAHDPEHVAATEASDRLSGARAARQRLHKRFAAGAGLLLLIGALVLMQRGRKRALPVNASA